MADMDVIEVLGYCSQWVSLREVASQLPHRSVDWTERQLSSLTEATMLRRFDQPPPERERLLRDWGEWTPVAAHFHLATRNVHFVNEDDLERPPVILQEEPSPLKEYTDARQVKLPSFTRSGELEEVFLGRRTWRRFADNAISLDQLSTLCGLTWAVQLWSRVNVGLPFALKTSPSGGARHSIEAYVCALNVEGLPRGLYHYGPDSHSLSLVRELVSDDDIESFLPAQRFYAEAGVIIFMTSVFARVQWRYHLARAYRNVYIEAGHLAQTFCLLATHLGLAPFCTAAVAEDAFEPAVCIDGVSEGVLYAVGAGTRPADAVWAPWWDDAAIPALSDPSFAARMKNEGAAQE